MKNIYEVFEEFKGLPEEDIVIILQMNATQILKNVLQGAFHPDIKYVIKEVPPYKKSDSPPGMAYTSIQQEFERIYLFVEGNQRVSPNLTLDRKKVILAQMLEAMEDKEATVFMNMLLKDLKVPGLTYQVVQEAFPGLLP